MPSRLDKEAVRALRVAYYDEGETQVTCAARFGVAEPTVWQIVHFQRWPHVLHHGRRYSPTELPERTKRPPLNPHCACGAFRARGKERCSACESKIHIEALERRLAAVEAALADATVRPAWIEIPEILRRGAD